MTSERNDLKIAVMQPYFFPYLGYLRLLRDVDYCCLNDVQFPRRGWVHRNRVTNNNGELDWLTLPIQKCERNTLIKDLEFKQNYEQWNESYVTKYACLAKQTHKSLLLLTQGG